MKIQITMGMVTVKLNKYNGKYFRIQRLQTSY